jgi:hypothetical protein
MASAAAAGVPLADQQALPFYLAQIHGMLFIGGKDFGVLNDDVGRSHADGLLRGGGKSPSEEQEQEDQRMSPRPC